MPNSFAAALNIGISGFCGIVHPIFYGYNSLFLYMCLLLLWGWTVSADSPQFSALASRACKQELLGTALTVYNCIGYFMTVISIQLCQSLAKYISMQYVSWIIALGPITGFFAIASRVKKDGMWLIPQPDSVPKRSSSIVNASADISVIEEKDTSATGIEMKPINMVVEEIKVAKSVSQPREAIFDIGADEPDTEPSAPPIGVATPPEGTEMIGKKQPVV
jgi:hypothetical protein